MIQIHEKISNSSTDLFLLKNMFTLNFSNSTCLFTLGSWLVGYIIATDSGSFFTKCSQSLFHWLNLDYFLVSFLFHSIWYLHVWKYGEGPHFFRKKYMTFCHSKRKSDDVASQVIYVYKLSRQAFLCREKCQTLLTSKIPLTNRSDQTDSVIFNVHLWPQKAASVLKPET